MSDFKLIVSIINFLKDECQKAELSDDTRESLEVAIQCLQTAYDLKQQDIETYSHQMPRSLVDIFNEAVQNTQPDSSDQKLSESAQMEAEKYKTLGNDLMKAERNAEAVDAYTQAISLNGNNAVYYCNRAAAYSRLGDYNAAVRDCEQAIALDPKYSKAYGRMGLAYSSLGNNAKAVECYKKAVELDPSNESYKSNLKLAQDKASRGGTEGNQLADLLNNPVLRNLASRVMQDPTMVNIVSGLMSATINEGNLGSMDFYQAGQQAARQMQQTNPELIEQLREQFLSAVGQGSQNSDKKDPTSN